MRKVFFIDAFSVIFYHKRHGDIVLRGAYFYISAGSGMLDAVFDDIGKSFPEPVFISFYLYCFGNAAFQFYFGSF